MVEKQDETTTEIRGLREVQNVMVEKQDETTAEIKGLREAQNETIEEIRGGFESLGSKTDVMIDETRGLREDMKGYMDMKFGKIEGELDLIKGALKERGILC